MKIHTIAIENFGPFHGRHEVDLDVHSDEPVILFHGENMRGKTSLLNSVRWCLYGSGKGRGGRAKDSFVFMNYDALGEGDYHMSVTLQFEHDGHEYVLERHVQSESEPTGDAGLTMSLHLRKDSKIQPAKFVQELINEILHPDIARFFLFDGEMLEEYEILLVDQAKGAALVKQSVEQILGLPSFQIGVENCDALRRGGEKQQIRYLKQQQKNEERVSEAQKLFNELEALEKETITLQAAAEELEKEREDLHARRSRYASLEADIREMEGVEQAIEEVDAERRQHLDECKHILRDRWWLPISRHADAQLKKARDYAAEAAQQIQHANFLQREIAFLRESISKTSCALCQKPLDASEVQNKYDALNLREQQLAEINLAEADLAKPLTTARILETFASIADLERFTDRERGSRRLGIRLRKLERQAEELSDRLKNHDRSEIRKIESRYDECVGQLRDIKRDLEDTMTRRDSSKSELARTQNEISKLPDANPRIAAEIALLSALRTLFSYAIEEFREALKLEVEHMASHVFRLLTTETEYAALRINKNYGLTIVDDQGREIAERSAGAEQIVALSLVAALNSSAVREGPVIIDTPFGRLDTGHRRNILEFLPKLGAQVGLLVQSGEFQRDRDMTVVEAYVGREYKIVKDTSPTSSRIERVK